jgi:methionine sulfoxide reductase heme-binding subunit
LHRLIYFSAIAGVIHYLWLVKADIHKPLEYGAILAVLLAYRVVIWQRQSSGTRPAITTLPRKIAVE